MALRYMFTVTLLVLGLATLPDAFGARETIDVAMSNCKGDLEIEHSLTAYAQWVHFQIKYVSPGKLVVKNSRLSWGKWYSSGNKDDEIGSPDKTKIDASQPLDLYSCGRSDASSGTEGYFELWEDKNNGALVTKVYWNCPWGSKQNTLIVNGVGKYVTGTTGGNFDSGAIGDVTLTVVQISSVSVV